MAATNLERLEQNLKRAVPGMERLAALLGEERAALGGDDPAALETVVARKVELLADIEPALNELAGTLDSLGLGPPDEPTLDRLAAQPETAELARLWQRLRRLSGEIDAHNLRNGQLATQKERATRTALSILTGRASEDETYSARGTSRSRLAAYSLAKA